MSLDPREKKRKPEASRWRDRGYSPHEYIYPITAILKARDKLAAQLSEFAGTQPRGKTFNRLVQIVWEALPVGIERWYVEESLRFCSSMVMTEDIIYNTAWRIMGNVPRLRKDQSVPPWTFQSFPEKVPMHILSCRPERSRSGAIGAIYRFRVLAGTSCPNIIEKWWSQKQANYYSWDGFGFSRARGRRSVPRYPFTNLFQLVNLRCVGLIEPQLCRSGPMFQHPSWTVNIDQWNKEIIKRRFRIDDGYTCPQGYARTFPCHFCTQGYLTCPAATHRHPWKQKACPECKNEDAYFDRDISRTVCVDCAVKEGLKRKV